ncbi:MAG: AmmeMemoRadiSam system protein B [Deltaproteobacteria bacterium]|nr:AmmeMemoRadiSam system protein B [Deltaproteobacteria bacterium]
METVRLGDYFARQGWYPLDSEGCRAAIDGFVKERGESRALDVSAQGWSGGVVPHAGWAFSGRLACRVFDTLSRGEGDPVSRVVLFGGHLGPRSRGWILRSGRWETPVGALDTDEEFVELVVSRINHDGIDVLPPSGYEPDNTIELQMPMVRHFFEGARVVTLGVPARLEGLEVGRMVAEVAARSKGRTLFVGSTDLTHYGLNYGFSPVGLGPEAVEWVREKNDRAALDCIEALDAAALLEGALERRNACCPGAAGAALAAGRQVGAKRGAVLDYGTSYDVRPDNSFVGYVAAVF